MYESCVLCVYVCVLVEDGGVRELLVECKGEVKHYAIARMRSCYHHPGIMQTIPASNRSPLQINWSNVV